MSRKYLYEKHSVFKILSNTFFNMATFKDHLQRIHQEIAIKDEDRQPYTEMYNTIRDWLLDEMCKADPMFNKMYKGTSLFGSYPNRVRIIKPSEFDVFILMDLPFEFTVETHPKRPGFIHISSMKWENCATDSKTETLYKGLFGYNKKSVLNRNKLKRWIKNIIKKVLSSRPQPIGYTIKYTCCSVAHQIYVRDERAPYKTISIDFVPAIRMPKEYMKPLVGKNACLKDEYYETFVAIPKCLEGCGPRTSRKLTFQLVNPVAERDIIWDKQNLKVIYRLLKSLRNQYKLPRLKSYFLTAVFLQQVTKCNDEFWQQSVSYIFLYMLDKMIVYFQQGDLPYYWVSGFNLLSILRPEEIGDYTDILTAAYNDLKKLEHQNSVSYAVMAEHFKTT
ncbi:cyclic GMP-AMP synthase-like receptor 1 [Calliphora vicina]|uniref:cyclic GMP-AMP synthase-like receptor 1 n=1 Tax=Calliphora vicina TaxID=7373 RepID=UPI00325A893D